MLLYKYRSLQNDSRKFTFEAISHQSLFFSNPDKFNDPFEFRPIVSLEASNTEFAEYLEGFYKRTCPWMNRTQRRESISNLVKDSSRNHKSNAAADAMRNGMHQLTKKCGVFCLSEDPKNILMWAHYADNHSGLCLGFDGTSTNEFFGKAQKVKYSDSYPIVNIIRDDPQNYHEKSVLTKSDHWDYEREWRIIDHENGAGIYRYSIDDLKEVIFGLNTDALVINEVKSLLITSGCKPRLYQTKRHLTEFELTLIEIELNSTIDS